MVGCSLKKGKGKGNGSGKGKCKVEGKGKDRTEENTVVGLDKHGVEIYWSSDRAVEGDRAARELAAVWVALSEEWRVQYREFTCMYNLVPQTSVALRGYGGDARGTQLSSHILICIIL